MKNIHGVLFGVCIFLTAVTMPYGIPPSAADWFVPGCLLVAALVFWCLWVWTGKE